MWTSHPLVCSLSFGTPHLDKATDKSRLPESIKSAAALVAEDLMTFYHGDEPGQIPGILPGPPPGGDYYWWNAGAMWGTLIDYWLATGDTTYNAEIEHSLVFQAGEGREYEPSNWTASLGNDDQAFWGFSALLAAESKFQNPPESDPQWLALAQAVFNRQSLPDRHDDACGGGMRWQIPAYNIGYDYKNTIANGCYFNIGARLARYTENNTYAELAEQTWDWIWGVQYVDESYNVYDGGHVDKNCTDVFKAQFSYNAGVLLQGAAFMYNYVSLVPSFPRPPPPVLSLTFPEVWKLTMAMYVCRQKKKNGKRGLTGWLGGR